MFCCISRVHNSIDASRDIQIAASYGLYANKVSSKGNNDLVFHRNDVEYMRLSLTNKIITVANDAGLSSPDLFANEFLNRTRQYDTVFWGSHPTADSRVEYMRYNYAGESLDFNTVIDNTGLAVIGNIVDTTVSDERLKTNIEDVESNFTECVKNVKIKTFKYKDTKYKNNDTFGFFGLFDFSNFAVTFRLFDFLTFRLFEFCCNFLTFRTFWTFRFFDFSTFRLFDFSTF